MVRVILTAAALLLAPEPGRGSDDPIAAKLDGAQAKYEAEGAELYSAVVEAVLKAESAARAAGDQKRVDALREEKTVLYLTAVPPRSVPLPAELQERIKANRAAVVAACEAAVKDYTRAGKDDRAADVQDELRYHLRRPAVAVRLFLLVNKHSGLCLAPAAGGPGEGRGVIQDRVDGRPRQRWSVEASAEPVSYGLRNSASRRFLRVPGASRNPGTPLDQGGRVGSDPSELWTLTREEDHWRLALVANGLCAGVRESKKQPGVDVIQWVKAGDDQLWELRPAANRGIDDGHISAALERAKQAYLADVAGLTTDLVNHWQANEEAARKEGSKPKLDAVKTERKAFEEAGEYPTAMSKPLQDRLAVARRTMGAAYDAAVTACFDAGKDAEAERIEKQAEAFRKSFWAHLNADAATAKEDYLQLPRAAVIKTKAEYEGPIEIEVVARTPRDDIRIDGPRGSLVIFNYPTNSRELRLRRPDGAAWDTGSTMTGTAPPIAPNTWYRFRWRITNEEMQVFVNDRLTFSEERKYELNLKAPVMVRGHQSGADIRSVRVTRLLDQKK